MLAVGKLYEKCWQEAAQIFCTRLGAFAKLSVVEVAAEAQGATVRDDEVALREGERLLRQIPDGAFVVAMDRVGKMMSSEELSELIVREGAIGGHLVFVIGGSVGLDAAVLARAQFKVSMSKMTFTHEMARVILLEQVYRAMMIASGKKYHK